MCIEPQRLLQDDTNQNGGVGSSRGMWLTARYIYSRNMEMEHDTVTLKRPRQIVPDSRSLLGPNILCDTVHASDLNNQDGMLKTNGLVHGNRDKGWVESGRRLTARSFWAPRRLERLILVVGMTLDLMNSSVSGLGLHGLVITL